MIPKVKRMQETATSSSHGRIYVLCPAGAVTGGPECLHQLVHTARRLGFDAHMVYDPPSRDIPADYAQYDIAVADEVIDAPDHVVVMPEIYPAAINRYPAARKIYWWLSWSNGEKHYAKIQQADVLHACQSRFAFDMHLRRGTSRDRLAMLSDITRVAIHPSGTSGQREDLVVYNPCKGMEFTTALMATHPDLRFEAIRGMSPLLVEDLLRRAKVYIDFGHHPGKDRIPREAAAAGCCVVTSNDRGASSYFEDIPIPRRYKIPTRDFDPVAVGNLLRDCMTRYETCRSDFTYYRECIQAEAWIFEEELLEVLDRVGCSRRTTD